MDGARAATPDRRAATGRYRTALNEPLRRAGKISRADLARAMLDPLDNARSLKAILTLAY